MVNELNPDFVMAKYFLGNVFNDRFNMTKLYNPANVISGPISPVAARRYRLGD